MSARTRMQRLRDWPRKMWRRWVTMMDQREDGTSIALVRIAVGLVLLSDQLVAGKLGLVEHLWGPHTHGGLALAANQTPMPAMFEWFGPLPETAHILWWTMVGGCVCLALGVLGRLAAAVVVFASAQEAMIFPIGDRGIDIALRAICLILVFSRCTATLSVDSYIRKGKLHTGTLVPAWPRYFCVLQLLWIYFSAGFHKRGDWWPWQGSSALWRILNDPHFGRFDIRAYEWLYPFTQLGTLGTMCFEITPPIFLLALYYHRFPHRAGAIGTFLQRIRFRELWLTLGITFHLGLMVTMRLGIFPAGVLALYPAFFHPDELRTYARTLRTRLRPHRPPPPIDAHGRVTATYSCTSTSSCTFTFTYSCTSTSTYPCTFSPTPHRWPVVNIEDDFPPNDQPSAHFREHRDDPYQELLALAMCSLVDQAHDAKRVEERPALHGRAS